MARKIVLLGASGMLGQELAESLRSETLIAPSRKQCDLNSWSAVEKFFRQINHADLVINCAAFTHVDQCEEQSALAFAINASGPEIIAKCCEKIQAPLLHVSTDYVFNGLNKGYSVTDKPESPNSIYGRSKLIGEINVQRNASRHFIVRTAWLYGNHGHNFVETVLNLAKTQDHLKIVSDQIGCPTYTKDLIAAILRLSETEAYGVHHAAGTGECSWYDFAKEILSLAGIEKTVVPISTKKSFEIFPRIKAKRPAFSVLKNSLLMRDWKIALKDYLESKIINNENTLDIG